MELPARARAGCTQFRNLKLNILARERGAQEEERRNESERKRERIQCLGEEASSRPLEMGLLTRRMKLLKRQRHVPGDEAISSAGAGKRPSFHG